MITLKDYLMGREIKYPISEEMLKNAQELLKRVNALLADLGIDKVIVNSGYRPPAIAVAQGLKTSKTSAHAVCMAIDIKDNGKIKNLISVALLEKHDLYMENIAYTKTWVHFQTRPTKSGVRIFIP